MWGIASHAAVVKLETDDAAPSSQHGAEGVAAPESREIVFLKSYSLSPGTGKGLKLHAQACIPLLRRKASEAFWRARGRRWRIWSEPDFRSGRMGNIAR